MPEEKKEKFTFSDKIKSSKASGNKSFAKPSSKIGRDGKPRQTLFERTRRDAPFFIAALVALLLLPFLYKYSGQPSEESAFAPTGEESMFDPERYGFDTAMVEDPDGQIAQLSGRDSLSLIKGWGANQEADYGRDDMDFDASIGTDYDAEGRYAKAHQESSNVDVEENTTNIYKKRAKAGTRAAFRRAATKVGALNPAAMRRPGGGGLGVKNFGGSIKNAAQKVKPSTPSEGPKPVSLQPLRAKSGRAAFGSTGTAGRKSRDAMGKADAVAALRDAQVKPVDPTRVGGLDLFSAGPGGGSGKLGHTINIGNGKEPWWWDMMKTRMQKEWEAEFNRKWDWIKFWDKLAQDILGTVLKNMTFCLATGNSDGDVDHFLGNYEGSSSGKKECCGMDESGWMANATLSKLPFDSKHCKNNLKTVMDAKGKDKCDFKWKDTTHGGGGAQGFVGQRLCCLGFCGLSAYASGAAGLTEGSSGHTCESLDRHHYSVHPEGQARKWNVYHYIVARNYVPVNFKQTAPSKDNGIADPDGLKYQLQLCSVYGNNLKMDRSSSAGLTIKYNLSPEDAAYLERLEQDGQDGKKTPEQIRQEMEKYAEEHAGSVYKENDEQFRLSESYDPEALDSACVIYVAHGKVLDWEKGFKPQMVELLANLIVDGVNNGRLEVAGIDKNAGVNDVKIRNAAENAFYSLDLMFIESMASKKKLGKATMFKSGHRFDNGDSTMLPMPYWQFYEAYLSRYGSTLHNGSRRQVSKRKERTEGVDSVIDGRCYFHNDIQLTCGPQENQAKVTFGRSYRAGTAGANDMSHSNDITVTAQFRPLAGGTGPEQTINKKAGNDRQVVYTFDKAYTTTTVSSPTAAQELKYLVGNVVWKVYRAGLNVNSTTCEVNLSGEPITPYIPPEKCTAGAVEKLPAEKVAGQCQKQRTCSSEGTWGDWVNVPGDRDCDTPTPPPGQDQVVHFYDLITKIPCNTDITNGTRRVDDATGCLTWETCKLTQSRALLLPLDDDTRGYLTRAQNKFNQANAGQKIKLEYNVDSLSVANLIDAIMIDPDGGTVPANTVCLLGKTIGANAKDPQAQNFDNLFGVFLAFIGYDSASFPSQKTKDCNGTTVTDKRFLCRSEYYWGGYVNSKERINYERQVSAASSPWRNFPLKALARNPFPKTGDRMTLTDRENRVRFHGSKPDGYADLLRRTPCEYESTQKVARADVIEYINRLCQHGDQIKPKATKRYDCSRRYSDGAHHQQTVDCDTVDCFN